MVLQKIINNNDVHNCRQKHGIVKKTIQKQGKAANCDTRGQGEWKGIGYKKAKKQTIRTNTAFLYTEHREGKEKKCVQ